MSNRNNNFDFIRFVAAVLVLFSHSWPLTTGSNVDEPLAIVSDYQLDCGALAVNIFFIVSGFLVTQSFVRSSNAAAFAKARFLRIVPGLFIVVMILEIIVGPIATTGPSTTYWRDFPFLSFIGDRLPGVFVGNPFSGAVDGSLWTIKFEVLCYIMVAILGLLSLLTNRYAMMSLWLIGMTPIAFHHSLGLLPFFATGMLCYAFRKHVPINGAIAGVSFVLALLGIFAHISHWVLPLTLGYIVFWFSYTPGIRLQNFGKYGDWSYGIYIYSFPIQQLLVQYSGVRNPIMLFIVSLPVTLLPSALSWHLIEKNALKLKHIAIRPLLKGNLVSGD